MLHLELDQLLIEVMEVCFRACRLVQTKIAVLQRGRDMSRIFWQQRHALLEGIFEKQNSGGTGSRAMCAAHSWNLQCNRKHMQIFSRVYYYEHWQVKKKQQKLPLYHDTCWWVDMLHFWQSVNISKVLKKENYEVVTFIAKCLSIPSVHSKHCMTWITSPTLTLVLTDTGGKAGHQDGRLCLLEATVPLYLILLLEWEYRFYWSDINK